MLDLAIVGDGIAAQAMALAFAKAGRHVHLISDASSGVAGGGGGVQVAPNAWAALDILGVSEAALKQATPLAMLRIINIETGFNLACLPLNETPNRTPYTSMQHTALATILASSAQQTGNITTINSRLEAIENGDGCVHLTLQGGMRIKAAWLIGCDGARGISRRFVEAGEKRKRLHTRSAFRALIPASEQRLFTGIASNLWLGKNGHIVHYPIADAITGDSVNLVVVVRASPLGNKEAGNKEAGDRKTAAREAALRLLDSQQLLAPMRMAIEKAVEIPLYDYALVDAWQRGRVVLAGDAAHPMPPHLAQGAGQSLIDASSLATMLKSYDDDNLQPIITAWSAMRMRAVREVIVSSQRAGKILALDGGFARLRNIGLMLTGDIVLGRVLDKLWAKENARHEAGRLL